MEFLRDRQTFLDEVYKGVKLQHKIVSLSICSSVLIALYGAIIGSSSGWLQMLLSAIKLPALYLITLMICLPTLYFFDVISGSRRTFSQYLALLLASTSAISILLFAFAPVTLFFRLSINDYLFFKLLNVAIFVATGLIGINFFYKGMTYIVNQDIDENPHRPAIMKGWLILYGFVGSQLGWTLRPFFGAPGAPVTLFREQDSNFYMHMLNTLADLLGFQ